MLHLLFGAALAFTLLTLCSAGIGRRRPPDRHSPAAIFGRCVMAHMAMDDITAGIPRDQFVAKWLPAAQDDAGATYDGVMAARRRA